MKITNNNILNKDNIREHCGYIAFKKLYSFNYMLFYVCANINMLFEYMQQTDSFLSDKNIDITENDYRLLKIFQSKSNTCVTGFLNSTYSFREYVNNCSESNQFSKIFDSNADKDSLITFFTTLREYICHVGILPFTWQVKIHYNPKIEYCRLEMKEEQKRIFIEYCSLEKINNKRKSARKIQRHNEAAMFLKNKNNIEIYIMMQECYERLKNFYHKIKDIIFDEYYNQIKSCNEFLKNEEITARSTVSFLLKKPVYMYDYEKTDTYFLEKDMGGSPVMWDIDVS